MSYVLSRHDVDSISLNDIKVMAKSQYQKLWNAAYSYNRDLKIYLNWTAGRYSQFWDDYHLQVDYDGKIYIPSDVELSTILPATYARNAGSVAITALCGYTSNTKSLGSEKITTEQIETISRIIAVLSQYLNVPIDKKHVLTHGEAADNEDGLYLHDNYGPKNTCERWDLEYLGTYESPKFNPYNEASRGGTILRGKALWYKNTYAAEVEKHF